MTNLKPFRQKAIETLVILIFGLGAFLVVNLLIDVSNKLFHKGDAKTDPVETIKETPNFYTEKDLLNKTIIIGNYKNTVVNGSPNKNFKKIMSTSGVIKQGYVYVKANVAKKPLTDFDSVYLKLENNHTLEQLGGKLVKDKSLETPQNNDSTEFLFDLANVQYKKSNKDGYETISGNWLKMLNENLSDKKTIIGFSSTLRAGEIEEIDFFYECEVNSDCSINIEQ